MSDKIGKHYSENLSDYKLAKRLARLERQLKRQEAGSVGHHETQAHFDTEKPVSKQDNG